ncbi:hypothetical protein ACFXJJ_27070, partial [Streptomyces sp. NPDC059233]
PRSRRGPRRPAGGLAIMLVAGGLSLAALTTHLADPKFRKPLKDGFTKGEFDADFWKSSVTLLGDATGSVPGIAAVASGAKAGTAAARAAMAAAPEAVALSSLGTGATAFRSTTWSTGLAIQEVENPLVTWAVRTTDPTARKAAGLVAPVAGGLTGIGGHLSDSESVERASTAADGVRGVLDDAPSAGAKAAGAWAAMRP